MQMLPFSVRPRPPLWPLLFVVLLWAVLSPLPGAAQSAARPSAANTTDLAPVFIDDYRPGDTVTVALEHAGLTYKPTDTITLYRANGAPLSAASRQLRQLCASVAACQPSADTAEGATLPRPASAGSSAYRWPVHFQVAAPLTPRTYLIEVRNESSAVKHYRRLRLVPPAPYVDHVTVSQEGPSTDDSSALRVDPTQGLDAEITITGGPFYAGTQVLLQGEPLVVRRRSTDELVLDLTIEAETTRHLELGVWPLQFQHSQATAARVASWNAVLATVTLRGNEPPFLEPPQPLYVVGTQAGRTTRKVTVAGYYFSPRAQLCTEAGSLVSAQCIGITQRNEQSLTAPVVLDIPTNFSGGAVTVYVRNGDGQESARRTIRVRPQQVTATVSPVSPDEPVVEGVPTEIVFHREAASTFPRSGPFTLTVNGNEQSLAPIQPPTADELRTTVTLPDGTGGQQPVFVLSASGRSWAGTFDVVVQRPRLIAGPSVLRPSSEARLTFVPPTENGHLLTRTPGVDIEGSGLFDGEARLRTADDLTDTTASILIRVQSRVVDSLRLLIEPWPNPDRVLTLRQREQSLPLASGSVMMVEADAPLKLHPDEAFVGADRPPRVSAQLRDANGTALQAPIPIRFDRPVPTTITPSTWGLSGGDAFTLALQTPDGRTLHRRAYIRRPLIEQFVVSGGLTAVEYGLGSGEDARGNTLSGVNLALHWVPEWFAPTLSRPVGMGLHAVASENDNQVRLRVAASVLLFEKLALGLSAGQGGAALFVGANASFLDLSTLFRRRGGSSR